MYNFLIILFSIETSSRNSYFRKFVWCNSCGSSWSTVSHSGKVRKKFIVRQLIRKLFFFTDIDNLFSVIRKWHHLMLQFIGQNILFDTKEHIISHRQEETWSMITFQIIQHNLFYYFFSFQFYWILFIWYFDIYLHSDVCFEMVFN